MNFWKAPKHWFQFDSPWEVPLAADRSLCTKWSIWLLSWSFWLLLFLLQQQLIWIPSYFSPGKWLCSEIPGMGSLWAARRVCFIWLPSFVTEIILVWIFLSWNTQPLLYSCSTESRADWNPTEKRRFAVGFGTFMFSLQFTLCPTEQLYQGLKCIKKIFPSSWSNPTP